MDKVFIPKDLCAMFGCENEAQSIDDPFCSDRCEQEYFEALERSSEDGSQVSAT